jgi:hypothetical protein
VLSELLKLFPKLPAARQKPVRGPTKLILVHRFSSKYGNELFCAHKAHKYYYTILLYKSQIIVYIY